MTRKYRIKEIVHKDGSSTFVPQRKLGFFWFGWDHPLFVGCFEFENREEAEHFLNEKERSALHVEGRRQVCVKTHPYVPAIEV